MNYLARIDKLEGKLEKAFDAFDVDKLEGKLEKAFDAFDVDKLEGKLEKAFDAFDVATVEAIELLREMNVALQQKEKK